MKKAIITGTFDPITKGHTDVVRTAAGMFDCVYLCVLNNAEKRTMFTEAERLRIAEVAVDALRAEGITNVTAESYSGLTSDFMTENGIRYIVKGIRNSTDFDYEYGMARIMKKFLPGCETVFIPAEPEHVHISSTFVREIIKYGGPLEDAVPAGTAGLIRAIRGENND
ncbi:MAG: pantetheine-phosphate adenylyltransferase [Clostridia bacterium]|nr:pantetheine-phosphate adenylyltransferase [Clostridia bacterium]